MIPEDDARRRELRAYAIGFAMAAALTGVAFAIVAGRMMGTGATLLSLGGLALVQVAVHFRYFLHIDLEKSHRDDLQLVLFTALIVAVMVGGSLWILWDQHARMM